MADRQNDYPPLWHKIALIVIFLFGLFMGAGPGLYLVNDYAAEGGTLLGMPVLYTWAVMWFGLDAAVVVTAYLTIWEEDGE